MLKKLLVGIFVVLCITVVYAKENTGRIALHPMEKGANGVRPFLVINNIIKIEISSAQGYFMTDDKLAIFHGERLENDQIYYLGTIYEIQNDKLNLIYNTITTKKYKKVYTSLLQPLYENIDIQKKVGLDLISQKISKNDTAHVSDIEQEKSLVKEAAIKKFYFYDDIQHEPNPKDELEIVDIKVFRNWASAHCKNSRAPGRLAYLFKKVDGKWNYVYSSSMGYNINEKMFYKLHIEKEVLYNLKWIIYNFPGE